MLKSWIENQRTLLDLELEEENSQLSNKINSASAKYCESEGLSILNLEIDSLQSGLFGRCRITLQKMGNSKQRFDHSFKVGDEVNLYNPKFKSSVADSILFGLITKINLNQIEVTVDEMNHEPYFEPPLRIDLRANMKTHNKMKEVLSILPRTDHPLINISFQPPNDAIDPAYMTMRPAPVVAWFDGKLNASQKDAVRLALGAPTVTIIHGPPGIFPCPSSFWHILLTYITFCRMFVCRHG